MIPFVVINDKNVLSNCEEKNKKQMGSKRVRFKHPELTYAEVTRGPWKHTKIVRYQIPMTDPKLQTTNAHNPTNCGFYPDYKLVKIEYNSYLIRVLYTSLLFKYAS